MKFYEQDPKIHKVIMLGDIGEKKHGHHRYMYKGANQITLCRKTILNQLNKHTVIQ